MRFRRKMDDRIDLIAIQYRVHFVPVANIVMYENMALRIRQIPEVLQAACIGLGIQIDNLTIRLFGQEMADKIRADKTRSSCDKYVFHRSTRYMT